MNLAESQFTQSSFAFPWQHPLGYCCTTHCLVLILSHARIFTPKIARDPYPMPHTVIDRHCQTIT